MKQYSKLLKETTSPSKFAKEVRKDETATKELISFIGTIEEVCNFLEKRNSCKEVAKFFLTVPEGQFIKFLSMNLPASAKITASNFATCIKRVSERRTINELEGVEITPADLAKVKKIVMEAEQKAEAAKEAEAKKA